MLYLYRRGRCQILERLHRKQYAYQFMKELDTNYRAHAGEGYTQGRMNTYGLPGVFFFFKSCQILIEGMFCVNSTLKKWYIFLQDI